MKQYSWPDRHWNWPVQLSHQHGVRCGELAFTGGQADLDRHGKVVNPDDLQRQTRNVMQHVETILSDMGSCTADLVRLVVYFVGDFQAEQQILDILATRLDPLHKPSVTTICLPELCYPGMVIELEGIALLAAQGSPLKRQSIRSDKLPFLHSAYAHVVRCGDLIFTSDMSAIDSSGSVMAAGDLLRQTRIMMDQLSNALACADATTADVLKLNVFYAGDGTAENWQEPALIRAAHFPDPGPAATGIAVNGFATDGLMTKIAVTAAVNSPNKPVKYAWPANHWNWTTPLPYQHGNRWGTLIHLGGQVALDSNARVLHQGDIVRQTQIALDNIKKVLQELGASMDDVVKVTAFYHGKASATGLHENLMIRSAAFDTPGPATSGIPVPHLVYKDMLIEIEVIAMIDEAGD